MRLISTILACFGWLGGCNYKQRSAQENTAAIIFRSADGRTLTMEDLRSFTGTVQWEVIGKKDVPPEAESLHAQARRAGGAGDYSTALALLTRASDLAPKWPYPVYDMAYTYLLNKEGDNARKYYRKTLELAPRGFFTAITALHTLERERRSDLPVGTYLAYLSLEWVNDPRTKSELLHEMVTRVPRFAPAWKDLSETFNTDSERLAAIENGLVADPDSETRGMLLINKALVMDHTGHHSGAVKLLGELALDPKSTLGTEQWAKATLALVLAGK
jgi:hypothetical protein